jgi:hypothetical protein
MKIFLSDRMIDLWRCDRVRVCVCRKRRKRIEEKREHDGGSRTKSAGPSAAPASKRGQKCVIL